MLIICSPTGEWATQHNISTLRNNAELLDRNTANQKLTPADIAAMRASGKVGLPRLETCFRMECFAVAQQAQASQLHS